MPSVAGAVVWWRLYADACRRDRFWRCACRRKWIRSEQINAAFTLTLAIIQPQRGDQRLAVRFQQVVHSSKTREADCDEQSTPSGRPEWTSIRMHDLPSSVESSWPNKSFSSR